MPKLDDEDRYNIEVGKRIAKAQKAAKIDDFTLAGNAKMSVRDLLIYKRGDRSMRTRRLLLLAQALSVTTDWLTGSSQSGV